MTESPISGVLNVDRDKKRILNGKRGNNIAYSRNWNRAGVTVSFSLDTFLVCNTQKLIFRLRAGKIANVKRLPCLLRQL
jgi:hypothetical protein